MKNHIITLTGPSCVGKGYLKKFLKDFFDLEEINVYTTRQPRTKIENDGRIFLNERKFLVRLNNNEFTLVNNIFGAYYAFKTSDLKEILQQNRNFITELYVDNATIFRNMFSSANMIAIITDSLNFLECRFKRRLEDSSITARLNSAKLEIEKILKNRYLFDLVYTVNSYNENNIVGDITKYIQDGMNVRNNCLRKKN